MIKIFILKIVFVLIFFTKNVFADEASRWLKNEIDLILSAYSNNNISSEERFSLIETTIESASDTQFPMVSVT